MSYNILTGIYEGSGYLRSANTVVTAGNNSLYFDSAASFFVGDYLFTGNNSYFEIGIDIGTLFFEGFNGGGDQSFFSIDPNELLLTAEDSNLTTSSVNFTASSKRLVDLQFSKDVSQDGSGPKVGEVGFLANVRPDGTEHRAYLYSQGAAPATDYRVVIGHNISDIGPAGSQTNGFSIHSQGNQDKEFFSIDMSSLTGATTIANQLVLPNYGSGSFSGTSTKILTVDATGNVIEEDLGIIENFYTADGIITTPRTVNTLNNPLIFDTTAYFVIEDSDSNDYSITFVTDVTSGAMGIFMDGLNQEYDLEFSVGGNPNGLTFDIRNDVTGARVGKMQVGQNKLELFHSENVSSGSEFNFLAQSRSNYGMQFDMAVNDAANSSEEFGLSMGTDIVSDGGFNEQGINPTKTKLTDVGMVFWRNSGFLEPLIEINPTIGSEKIHFHTDLQFVGYGTGSKTGTTTQLLGVDTNGNVIEESLSGLQNIYNSNGTIGEHRTITVNPANLFVGFDGDANYHWGDFFGDVFNYVYFRSKASTLPTFTGYHYRASDQYAIEWIFSPDTFEVDLQTNSTFGITNTLKITENYDSWKSTGINNADVRLEFHHDGVGATSAENTNRMVNISIADRTSAATGSKYSRFGLTNTPLSTIWTNVTENNDFSGSLDQETSGTSFVIYNTQTIPSVDNKVFFEIDMSSSNGKIYSHNQLNLVDYGAGIYTGTETYLLGIDANGNVIEVAVGVNDSIYANNGDLPVGITRLVTQNDSKLQFFGSSGNTSSDVFFQHDEVFISVSETALVDSNFIRIRENELIISSDVGASSPREFKVDTNGFSFTVDTGETMVLGNYVFNVDESLTGKTGYVLKLNGSGIITLSPESGGGGGGGNTIYSADDVLAGPRVVDLNSNDLTFKGDSQISLGDIDSIGNDTTFTINDQFQQINWIAGKSSGTYTNTSLRNRFFEQSVFDQTLTFGSESIITQSRDIFLDKDARIDVNKGDGTVRPYVELSSGGTTGGRAQLIVSDNMDTIPGLPTILTGRGVSFSSDATGVEYMSIDMSLGSGQVVFRNQLRFRSYGVGNYSSGVPEYTLKVDSNGNLIEKSDQTIANTPLIAIDNLLHDWDNYQLSIVNMSSLTMTANNSGGSATSRFSLSSTVGFPVYLEHADSSNANPAFLQLHYNAPTILSSGAGGSSTLVLRNLDGRNNNIIPGAALLSLDNSGTLGHTSVPMASGTPGADGNYLMVFTESSGNVTTAFQEYKNIYISNGDITGNRVVNTGLFDMVFNGTGLIKLGANTGGNGTLLTVSDSSQTISVGPYVFDTSQTVGATQDGYSLVYSHSTGQIILQPVSGGGNSIYAADGIIGSNRTATISNYLRFNTTSSTIGIGVNVVPATIFHVKKDGTGEVARFTGTFDSNYLSFEHFNGSNSVVGTNNSGDSALKLKPSSNGINNGSIEVIHDGQVNFSFHKGFMQFFVNDSDSGNPQFVSFSSTWGELWYGRPGGFGSLSGQGRFYVKHGKNVVIDQLAYLSDLGLQITSNDTTPGTLQDKISSGSGIEITEVVNPGGDEEVVLAEKQISGSAGTPGALTIHTSSIHGNNSSDGRILRRLLTFSSVDNSFVGWQSTGANSGIQTTMLANSDGLPVWYRITGNFNTNNQTGNNRQGIEANATDPNGTLASASDLIPIKVGPLRKEASFDNIELHIDASDLKAGVQGEITLLIEFLGS